MGVFNLDLLKLKFLGLWIFFQRFYLLQENITGFINNQQVELTCIYLTSLSLVLHVYAVKVLRNYCVYEEKLEVCSC